MTEAEATTLGYGLSQVQNGAEPKFMIRYYGTLIDTAQCYSKSEALLWIRGHNWGVIEGRTQGRREKLTDIKRALEL